MGDGTDATAAGLQATAARQSVSPRHLLSIDVEEYFQVEAVAGTIGPGRWDQWPRRLPEAVDRALALLSRHEVRATFFILGWVATEQPEVVRLIAEAGHEIASHGMTHAMLGRLGPEAFRRELEDSRSLLEDLGGRAVLGFRAPTFSITHQTAWAIDVLSETGYRYDSSVFPVRHDRYGVPEAPPGPHVAIGAAGGRMLEIPPLTLPVLGANLPVGGGGYLRLFPSALIAHALGAAERAGRPGIIYLHPWELDPGQPVLPMSRLGRFRHRVGLARTATKLGRLIDRFAFGAIEDTLPQLECTEVEFRYGTQTEG